MANAKSRTSKAPKMTMMTIMTMTKETRLTRTDDNDDCDEMMPPMSSETSTFLPLFYLKDIKPGLFMINGFHCTPTVKSWMGFTVHRLSNLVIKSLSIISFSFIPFFCLFTFSGSLCAHKRIHTLESTREWERKEYAEHQTIDFGKGTSINIKNCHIARSLS